MNRIAASELMINEDGSVFHLHLRPEEVAHKIILVGDPDRVQLVASFFDEQELYRENREFKTVTGWYRGKRLSVISTGIGCGNIDIVMNELDALVNIDFNTRCVKEMHTTLEIIRIGTSGGLQLHTPIGSLVCTKKAIGMDGLFGFYRGRNEVGDRAFEQAFAEHMQWPEGRERPYVVPCDPGLLERINQGDLIDGVTITANGFYGPQGRVLRLPLSDPMQNEKIVSFRYNTYCITNFEMESAPIAGLALLLGHKALTVCMIIANRYKKEADTTYTTSMPDLIKLVLERF